MDALEQNIRKIIEDVLKGVNVPVSSTNSAPSSSGTTGQLGVFSDLNQAIEAAHTAFKQYDDVTVETRDKIIINIRKHATLRNEELAKMAVLETGLGKWEDKVQKNLLGINKTPGVEDVTPEAYTDSDGLTLIERAPYGVIGSITPSTNSVITIISNTIGMIAAGNSVVFNPHPGAKKVSCVIIDMLNKAITEAGGPLNLVTCIDIPTIASAKALMAHPKVAIMVVTGGPAVVKTSMDSGKKTMGAGPGNPPVVVDETAVIPRAAKCIVDGASFDNNLICICEKEVLVVASVADQLIAEMQKHNAFLLNPSQAAKITEMVIKDPGRPGHEGAATREFIGQDADKIAKAAGIDVPAGTKLLIMDVDVNHPLMWTEQLMPVLPIARVADVDTAIDLAVEREHGFRHTAMMHSTNILKLSKFAKKSNVSLFIKNGSSYAGLGFGGAGYASFTICSPTGEGVTKARTFTRERRCTMVETFRIV